MSTRRVTAARDKIAEILEPLGFEVSLSCGGKHDHVEVRGPIKAVHTISRGTRNDRSITADWARQWARGVARRIQEGSAA